MTVYVESNFVLEIALGQEQAGAAKAILERAERGEVTLALPAISLSEPFAAVRRRANDTRRLGNEFRRQLNELARSSPHLEDVRELESLAARLQSIERRELESLTATVRRRLDVAHIISLDAPVFSDTLHFMVQENLSHQDAAIYSSVRQHIETSDAARPHFFINRDRHFDVPSIHEDLISLGCELVVSFDELALRLEQELH